MKTVREWFQKVANDHDLEEDVRAELAYDPAVGRVGSVDVSVRDGVVAVKGTVYSLAQKWAVEHTIRSVAGIRDVEMDLLVDPPKDVFHSDEEIADAVATVLRWTAGVPDGVQVSVQDGRVTLEGTVGFLSERLAAADAVRPLVGVKQVDNRLVVATVAAADDIRASIEAAIRRRTGAREITVSYEDETVRLGGTARSWAVRATAEEAARLAPGVKDVANRIVIDGYAVAARP